ncbi:MAG TPA: hypothetical protein VGD55_00395 [Acidothermaceae bacterium]
MADIDGIAQELGQRAVQVEMAGAQLVQAAAAAVWTSIAADAFRAQVDHRRRECERVAAVLRGAAHDVLHFSSDVTAEKARLRRLELAAEHAAAAALSGAARAAHGLGSIVRL